MGSPAYFISNYRVRKIKKRGIKNVISKKKILTVITTKITNSHFL